MAKKGERKPQSWQEAWEREPSVRQWPVRGYACVAVRHPILLHWHLYVAVPVGHPWYERDYEGVPAEVHGGLTFSGRRIPLKPDAYDGGRLVWWLGCDFGHGGMDLVPMLVKRQPLLRAGTTYRTIAYVSHEAERLALQAERAAKERDMAEKMHS